MTKTWDVWIEKVPYTAHIEIIWEQPKSWEEFLDMIQSSIEGSENQNIKVECKCGERYILDEHSFPLREIQCKCWVYFIKLTDEDD